MKLNIAGCRVFIERNGIEDYQALSSVLGISVSVLELLEQGYKIGYDVVRDLYNSLGEQTVSEIIDFEEETLQGDTGANQGSDGGAVHARQVGESKIFGSTSESRNRPKDGRGNGRNPTV